MPDRLAQVVLDEAIWLLRCQMPQLRREESVLKLAAKAVVLRERGLSWSACVEALRLPPPLGTDTLRLLAVAYSRIIAHPIDETLDRAWGDTR